MATKTENEKVEALARAFAKVLEEWLGAGELGWAAELNAAEGDPNICHSHDFIDANEAMQEAWETTIGLVSPTDEGGCALWNAAWALAKKHGFWI